MATLALEKSISFKNILVATDFSEASRHAAQCAAAIATSNNAKLFLLNVVPPQRHLADPVPPDFDREFTTANHNLKALVAVESLEALRHENIVERGLVDEVVADVIRDKQIDLLVLGTHARTGLRKLVLGSVAEELFRDASCPVLTIGPTAAPVREIRRVLYVTDFGSASVHALPYAIDFADKKSGELILLHLVPPIPIEYIGPFWYPGTDVIECEAADQQNSLKQLRALLPSNKGLNCSVEHVVELHIPPEGIINFAKERNVDLIVMGIRETGISSPRMTAHMPWAIAYEVVCGAECPVLTVRA
jgi:nucleotide-binding universal stress UspA family protein